MRIGSSSMPEPPCDRVDQMVGRIEIRPATPDDIHLLPDLCTLLQDAVDGGASVGFLAPLAPSVAADYWRGTLGSAGASLVLLVALGPGGVIGSVQLSLSERENGSHRAEVQKLLVLASSRRQGVALKLMSALESHARSASRTLLVLDTQKGSAAESLYQRLGWSRAGEIPDFAAAPDGTLRATALYFKQIGA